jgi:hypothetical protein
MIMSTGFLIFMCLDASLVLFYFWKTVRGYFFMKGLVNWESAKGKMIFLEQKKIFNKVYFYPVVEFKTNSHKTASFRSEKINGNTFSEDTSLTILYDPYDSNKAVIKGYENVRFREGIIGTIALTVLNIAIAMLFLMMKFEF